MHSQYVHPKHPPDKEYRDDGPRDVNYPVASCFRLPKIEHAIMVAGPRAGACYTDLVVDVLYPVGVPNFRLARYLETTGV